MLSIIISWKDWTWKIKLKILREYLDFIAPSVYFKFHIQFPLWGVNMFCPTTKVALSDDLPYLNICPTWLFALQLFPAIFVGQLKNRAKYEIGRQSKLILNFIER